MSCEEGKHGLQVKLQGHCHVLSAAPPSDHRELRQSYSQKSDKPDNRDSGWTGEVLTKHLLHSTHRTSTSFISSRPRDKSDRDVPVCLRVPREREL